MLKILMFAGVLFMLNILLAQTQIPSCHDRKLSTWMLSEFEYGQRALYHEHCDAALYQRLVEPIWQLSVINDPKWMLLQNEYRLEMTKNLSIRSLTCHSYHLMQCSNTTGVSQCECLQFGPLYNLTYDTEKARCTAVTGSRCFTPLGYECPTDNLCMQARQPRLLNGECICVETSIILNFSPGDTGTCTGCAVDNINGQVFPSLY